MTRLTRYSPSPAMVVACSALLISLGGVGYAAIKLPANSVGTKQLKKSAVIGSKVKPHSLTGVNINLSKLGDVPSAATARNALHAATADSATHATTADSATHATTADSATHAATAGTATRAAAADNADKVATLSVAKLDFRAGASTPITQLLSGDGITISAACDSVGSLSLTATTSVDHSEYSVDNFDLALHHTGHNYNWRTTDPSVNLLAVTGLGYAEDSIGTFMAVTPTGGFVMAHYRLEEAGAFGNTGTIKCLVTGYAFVS